MYIQTVLGPVAADDFGPALPHEHVLVDFIGADQTGPHRYSPDDVAAVMQPYLDALPARGIRGFVDCTPAFLARDVKVLARLAGATGLHIVTNTGLYKEPFLPAYAFEETAEQLAMGWIQEWREGIDGTGIRPGFIKIAVNPGPLPPMQRKIVTAAALTSRATGLTVASHTGCGVAALEQLDILAAHGVRPDSFIAVHMDSEPNFDLHLAVARKGAWVEYDKIGGRPVEFHVDLIKRFVDAGFAGQLLLSHDAGWYHVGEPGGGKVRPFTTLTDDLAPALEAAGVKAEPLIYRNPARAYGLPGDSYGPAR